MFKELRAAATALALFAPACGGHGSSSGPASPSSTGSSPSNVPAAADFSRAPIDLSLVSAITPIGNLNPPDHTLPTNHSYFFHPSAPNAEVVAPAAGVVASIQRGNGDQLYVQASPHIAYDLAHVTLDASIVQNMLVAAGQRVGVTQSANEALDVGLIDDSVSLFFVRPDRYIDGTLHAASPFKYFDEPVKSQIYAKVGRAGADKDGKIDFDQAGRLSGNWFTPDLAAASTELFGNGSKHLSFARDVLDPSQIRVSIGGTLSISGAYFVQPGAIDPVNVSVGAGRVAYQLFFNTAATQPAGLLVVQLTSDTSLRAQTFPGAAPLTTDFTDAAISYVR